MNSFIDRYRLRIKPALLAVCIIFCFWDIQAQPSEWLSDDFVGSGFNNCIEVDGKYYLVAGSSLSKVDDSASVYQIIFYEVQFNPHSEPSLDLIETYRMEFLNDNLATLAVSYNHQHDQWIIVLYKRTTQSIYNYKILLLDQDFIPLAEQNIESEGGPVMFFHTVRGDKQYLLGSTLSPDLLFLMDFSNTGMTDLPDIQLKQSSPRTMFWISSMDIEPLTSNMIVFCSPGIAILDSSLYQVERHYYDKIGTRRHGNVRAAGDSYFSHAGTNKNQGNYESWLVLQKYDSEFNVLFRDTLGTEDQDNYPFLLKSLDIRNGELIIGGHLDGPVTHIALDKTIKKFYLAKYDMDMNQIWYKEYGGDRAYIFSGLHLLDDGGCLAYGFITDDSDGFRYAYVLHVDTNGDIITSQTLPPATEFSVQIINPGAETMRILNPEGLSAKIVLYDIQGRQVLQSEIGSGITDIPAGGLPAGMYPYTLIHEERVVAGGKWVKRE